jgi:hypothetical protein
MSRALIRKERPVARNAFGLALLVLVVAGCSHQKEQKAAEAKSSALRIRTDSLRKARHLVDSLVQIRFAACVDSARAELSKPAVVVKPKRKRKVKEQPVAAPSVELITMQAQTACTPDAMAPTATVAAANPAPVSPAAKDSGKATKKDSSKVVVRDSSKALVKDTSKTHVAVATDTAAHTGPQGAVDQAAWADSVQKARETEMYRETYAYSGGTRDPFNSLLNMAKSGPELADLQLVGIYQNLRTPSGSIAVFREKEGGKRHKLRAGDQVGRSRLVQIRDRDVVFMIEDFGFERQETLSLRKQEDVTP